MSGFGLHFGDPFQRFFARVADIRAEVLAFGTHPDLGLGLGARGVADRAQGGGDIEAFAAAGVFDPCRWFDMAVVVVDEEVPLLVGLP